MKNRIILTAGSIAFLFILLLAFSCKYEADPAQGDRPNIILIISDDQSWTDYSFMGHEHIQTHSLDRLASEGLTFTRGYTTAPLCRPALASMATGLYPHQHKVLGNDPVFDYGNMKLWGPEYLAERAAYNQKYIDGVKEAESLMDLLGEAGYVSLQTGKWWEGNPSNGGFTESMTHGDPEKGGRHGDAGLRIGREGLDIVYDFIDRADADDNPFFLWYAPFMPHAPHTPPDSLKEKYLPLAPSGPVASYWAMCEWFDLTCGQIMDFIHEKGMDDNTLFIYVTDNGWIQDPDRPNKFAPRSKREPYEMGIRTPIMYRWTGVIEPEMNTTVPVSSIDIATTVLNICGIEAPEKMQGINVLDKDELGARDVIFAETYAHDFTTIDSSLYYRVVLSDTWKLILPDPMNQPDKIPELFNIVDDPHEMENLIKEYPKIAEGLKNRMKEWWNK